MTLWLTKAAAFLNVANVMEVNLSSFKPVSWTCSTEKYFLSKILAFAKALVVFLVMGL